VKKMLALTSVAFGLMSVILWIVFCLFALSDMVHKTREMGQETKAKLREYVNKKLAD